MLVHDWHKFLKRWSRELLACEGAAEWGLPPEVVESGWMGYPAASAAEIEAAEKRLGLSMPPTYRAFLEVSNGWRTTGHFIDRLWPASDLLPLTARHADFVYMWSTADAKAQPVAEEDYRVYEPGRSQPLRMIYLQTAIELGDCDLGDIYCLLNPQISFPDGEYEVWFYDIEIIGDRFQSFWDFMQARHNAFLITNKPSIPVEMAPEPEVLAPRLPELIATLEAVRHSYRSVNSPNEAERLYSAGIARETERVARLVREVGAENRSAREIANRLGELVVRLERQRDEMERIRMVRAHDLSANYSKQKSDEDMIYTGQVHGLRKAIAPVRWFHYEIA